MKVKVEEKVYLQKYDIAYIMSHLDSIPATLVNEIFKDGGIFVMIGRNDALDFIYAFENPASISWIMSQDWIVDYNSAMFTSLTETKNSYKSLKKELNREIREFNAKDPTYRAKYYDECSDKFKKKQHQIESYQIMIDYIKGKISFSFPKEIYKKINRQKTSKKKSNFFTRLFKP